MMPCKSLPATAPNAVSRSPTIANLQAHPDNHHKFLDLLSAMADDLGYKNIPQTDLDKHYTAQGTINQMRLGTEIQEELLRVLKNTDALFAIPHQLQDPTPGQLPAIPALQRPTFPDRLKR